MHPRRPVRIDEPVPSKARRSTHVAMWRRPALPLLVVTVFTLTAAGAGQAHADAAGKTALAPAQDAGLFTGHGDHVHISSTAPRSASAHGWWTVDANVGEPPTHAIVTVQLQMKLQDENDATWIDAGEPGSERVKPGGGSANRANARVQCKNSARTIWRSVIDVDIIGYADSPNQTITPERAIPCRV
jgi:hypothetical protein